MDKDYLKTIDTNVAIIDLSIDNSFDAFTKALSSLAAKYGNRKILFTWTETTTNRVIVVLEPEVK